MFTCESCGYSTEKDVDMLAHLIECKGEPEKKGGTYAGFGEVFGDAQTFLNSDILEEGKENDK